MLSLTSRGVPEPIFLPSQLPSLSPPLQSGPDAFGEPMTDSDGLRSKCHLRHLHRCIEFRERNGQLRLLVNQVVAHLAND